MKKFIALLSSLFIISVCPTVIPEKHNCSITACADYDDEDGSYIEDDEYDEYGYDSDSEYGYDSDYDSDRDYGGDGSGIIRLLISLAIGIVIGIIVLASLKSQLKTVKLQHGADNYEKSGSFKITNQYDHFLYKKVEKQPINK